MTGESFPTPLAQITPAQLAQWLAAVRPQLDTGHLPQYIPELAQVNPQRFAVALQSAQGLMQQQGDIHCQFSLMSLMKPFLLLFALETVGAAAVFERVGNQPSDQSFHSLKQLAADRGFPRNPMINSGALTLVELLPGKNGPDRCAAFCQWLAQCTGLQLQVDTTILNSVRALPNDANRAIAQMLKNTGAIRNMSITLDTYNHICCLAITVGQLAQLGLLLAVPQSQVQRRSQQVVNAMMLTCGVYEASGPWAMRMGLPIKSGVSGGMLAIVPRQGAIALYSPIIDAAGNSIAGAALLEKLITELDLSIF